jgi:AraC-like DNA-binding protein
MNAIGRDAASASRTVGPAMQLQFDTADAPLSQRSQYWNEVIGSTYFPLSLRFRRPEAFDGKLSVWRLGAVSLSRLTSDPLSYTRLKRHLVHERDEHYLVTVPASTEVAFSQCGRDLRCGPGGFLLERSDEPYEFSYSRPNDLWVLKVRGGDLLDRVRLPDRFCAIPFDATGGVGSLFAQMLRLIPGRFEDMSPEVRATIGQQLVDLLALSLRNDDRVLRSSASSVREGHLARIEDYVRAHLSDPDLDPEQIAGACRISVRYLHALFRDVGLSVSQWIKTQRLHACRDALLDPFNRRSIGEIAFQWGFSDQAQFSRSFRSQFGISPRDLRQQREG